MDNIQQQGLQYNPQGKHIDVNGIQFHTLRSLHIRQLYMHWYMSQDYKHPRSVGNHYSHNIQERVVLKQ